MEKITVILQHGKGINEGKWKGNRLRLTVRKILEKFRADLMVVVSSPLGEIFRKNTCQIVWK